MDNSGWRRLKRGALIAVAAAWRELQDEFEDGDRTEVRLPDLMKRAASKGITIVPNIGIKEDDTELAVKGLSYVIEAEGKKHRIYGSHIGLTFEKLAATWGVKFDAGDADAVQAILGNLTLDEATYKALPISPKDAEFETKVAGQFVERVREFGWIEILPKLPSTAPDAVEIGFSMWSPKGNHKLKERSEGDFEGFDHNAGFAAAKRLANPKSLSSSDTTMKARATKIFYDDGTGTRVIPNSESLFFDAFDVSFLGTEKELALAVRALSDLPHWHICRGGLVDKGKRPRQEGWHRRHNSKIEGTNDVVSKPRQMLVLDIDKQSPVDGGRFLNDPAGAIRAYLDTYGPEQFRGVSFSYQLSSSCGVVKTDSDGNVLTDGGDKINAHVFILLDRPVPDEVLAAWLLAANARAKLEHGIDDAFDARALVTSQPIYTGKALLVNVDSILPDLGIGAVGRVDGTMKVSMDGIDATSITEEMIDLDQRLRDAGLEPPRGFKAAVGRARAAEHRVEHGTSLSAALPAQGNWKGGGLSLDAFEDRLLRSLSMQPGGILAPLQSAVGGYIAQCRGEVDVEGMVNKISAAGAAIAGSTEAAIARNKNLSPGEARTLVETYLTNYRISASEFPDISDRTNALLESAALNDDEEQALEAVRVAMATVGDPRDADISSGTGRRWRIERELAKSLCMEFTVEAAAKALAAEAGMPPREAVATCMKAVLEPDYTLSQWRLLRHLESEGSDTSHIRPFPQVQKVRLEKLAAQVLSGSAKGHLMNRAGNGIVGIEIDGMLLSLRSPSKWASGGWNSVADSDMVGAPLIVQPTSRIPESAGLWGSPPADANATIRIFALPSEAEAWMEEHGQPSDVRAIAFGGHTDRVAREALASITADLVDKGAVGVVMHASNLAAQDIAAELKVKGVPVAAPGIAGYPASLGQTVEHEAPAIEESDDITAMFDDLDAKLGQVGRGMSSPSRGIPMKG